jgi:hypothetical protein
LTDAAIPAKRPAFLDQRLKRRCIEETAKGKKVPKAAISFFDHLIGSYGRTETSVR